MVDLGARRSPASLECVQLCTCLQPCCCRAARAPAVAHDAAGSLEAGLLVHSLALPGRCPRRCQRIMKAAVALALVLVCRARKPSRETERIVAAESPQPPGAARRRRAPGGRKRKPLVDTATRC